MKNCDSKPRMAGVRVVKNFPSRLAVGVCLLQAFGLLMAGPLFNGKDLRGWKVDVPQADNNPDIQPSFIVRDGKLVSLGRPQGHLVTESSYRNYRLTIEYRFSAKSGNGGVMVHTSRLRAVGKMFPQSIEVQLRSGDAGDFICLLENIKVEDMEKRRPHKEGQRFGGGEGEARRILNLTDGSEKPTGQWNTMVIECSDAQIRVWVNGYLVNHGFQSTVQEGRIALQAEGTEIEFRKIDLSPLGEDDGKT